MRRVEFRRAGVREGEAVYDLWIDGEPVERGLDIQQVVQKIAERDETEMPARTPAQFLTPEHIPESWQRRECPKAF